MASEKNRPWIPSGAEIEAKMVERKITQAELAVITGISQPMISGIINEKRDTCTKNMRKIIRAFWY